MTHVIPRTAGRELDYLLACHCAPVIAGIKPANLIALHHTAGGRLPQQMERVARPLGERGIFFHVLARCAKRILLMVYHRERLEAWLQTGQNRELLACYGGYRDFGAGEALGRLTARFEQCECFPHEIGVFLGYPPEDVYGFIENGGRDYLLCGYWKVYGNVDSAKRTFTIYDRVREFFCARVADGEEIQHITYGGMMV